MGRRLGDVKCAPELLGRDGWDQCRGGEHRVEELHLGGDADLRAGLGSLLTAW